MISDDDYCTRIKPYFNCQRHITQNVKIDVWSCSTEQTKAHGSRTKISRSYSRPKQFPNTQWEHSRFQQFPKTSNFSNSQQVHQKILAEQMQYNLSSALKWVNAALLANILNRKQRRKNNKQIGSKCNYGQFSKISTL